MNAPDGAPAVISTDVLTKVYPGGAGGVTALNGLTVAVAPGVTGLIGANGAGKSTLIKILLGLLTPTRGRATVLGHDSVTAGERIRQLVGYMPEHDCLPPDVSATEFVTHMARMSGIPRTAAKERAAESLRHVGLHEERYRQIGTYSTGMKQRVKLAQALAGDPKLLLLDEPTNGLDPAGRNAMLELIARIGEEFGISILVASHLLGEIERVCDSLVAIDAGQLLRADSIGSFTASSHTVLIEVADGVAELRADLERRGLAARTYQGGLLVPLAAAGAGDDGAGDDGGHDGGGDHGDRTYDIVLDSVAALHLSLIRLELRRHQVEELFRDAGQPDGRQRDDQQREAADVR